ncbi:MAG TPA: SDR family oxidoreductase [Anaerolineales bacterium]|nr:SDR family oxidoreductase [Anaerolineales bacterium]
MKTSKVVLITGCSTGIGRNLAHRLAQSGYTVVATARQAETLDDLPAVLKLALDVTHAESVNDAVARTLHRFGRIDVLINNAGYTMLGALEEVSEEQTQRVFDVNVFGTLRMIRAVVPQMRSQRAGRIINISSIAGKLATPVNGTYSATKFALEALSDALRHELAPFGIQVVLIEPGAIKTHFDNTAQAYAQNILLNSASPYRTLYQQSDQFAASMRKDEPGPGAVSQVIEQAIQVSRPKARYLAAVPFSGRLVICLRDFVWNFVLKQMFKITPMEMQS